MLKIAIAGCGLIVRKKHLPAFLKFRQKLEVVALCDLNEAAARELAKKFNIKCVYTDFSKMLAEVKPDIVDISSPPATHSGLSIEAMQKNCHVLLEKPLALNTEDCDAIIDVAEKYNRKVCVIHNQIFNPVFVRAREIIAKGEIGKFLGMRIMLSTPYDYMTSKVAHWAHKLPAGVLGETGPHAVYLSLAFLNKIKEVSLNAKKLLPEFPWSTFEDFRINLVADNGISSVILLYGSNQWKAEVEIFASSGTLKLDLQNRFLLRYNRQGLSPFSVTKSTLGKACQIFKEAIFNSLQYIAGNALDMHSVIISKFLESIIDDTSPPITLQEAREVVRVMQTIVKTLDNMNNKGA